MVVHTGLDKDRADARQNPFWGLKARRGPVCWPGRRITRRRTKSRTGPPSRSGGSRSRDKSDRVGRLTQSWQPPSPSSPPSPLPYSSCPAHKIGLFSLPCSFESDYACEPIQSCLLEHASLSPPRPEFLPFSHLPSRSSPVSVCRLSVSRALPRQRTGAHCSPITGSPPPASTTATNV